MKAKRSRVIGVAAQEAIETLRVCDRPDSTIRKYFPRREGDAKSMFRYYYSEFRAAVNGTHRNGKSFSDFVYSRELGKIMD